MPTWDAKGNMTSDGSRSYSYDSENRMSATGATVFNYDPLGRSSGIGNPPAILYDSYLNEGEVERTPSTNAVQRRHVFGPVEKHRGRAYLPGPRRAF
jgi:hypothetical protein